MQEDIEIRRKRLRFRAHHRGTKELDIYLGGFADRHLAAMTSDELDQFEVILETDEVTIYGWISGRIAPPEIEDGHDRVMRRFLAYQPPAGAN